MKMQSNVQSQEISLSTHEGVENLKSQRPNAQKFHEVWNFLGGQSEHIHHQGLEGLIDKQHFHVFF